MILSKKELHDFLRYEKKKYLNGKFIFLREIIGISENVILWKFQKTLRKYEYHLNLKHYFLEKYYKIKLLKFRNKYGIRIPPNAFDLGLRIMHLGSILVNDNTRVGKDCCLHINTAIVASGKNNGAAKIGDNVIIGIGAIIVGDIVLGNSIAIGAGAVVNKSFEIDNVTIGGVPAKIISNNGSSTWVKR